MPAHKPLKLVPGKNGILLPEVQRTLSTLDEKDGAKDAGLRRLAEVYAAAIDEGLDAAIDARQLVAQAEDPDDAFEVAKRMLNALTKFAESTSTLELLGPKLQSALEALGASPRSRAVITKKPGGGSKPNDEPPAKPELTPFERRRRAAAERARNAQAAGLDGSTPVDPTA